MISGFDQKVTRPPFCSNCGHILRFYEYLPILSWFSTFGKCNYCHIAITKSYIALEIVVGLLAMILYYILGQNLEYFFIYFCLATLAILNIFIYSKHNVVPATITLSIIILGMIYRTLIDQEIALWLTSFSFAAITSLWIIRNKLATIDTGQENAINAPALIHLILPASLWCKNYGILAFATTMVIAWGLLSNKRGNKLFYPIELAALFFISLLNVI